MPGPLPKDPSRRVRRNLSPSSVALPPEGRSGPPPDWPFSKRPNRREKELWEELWAMPQAVMWERFAHIHPLARLVQLYIRGEKEPTSRVLAEIRATETDWGISPYGMKRLGWVVAEEESVDRKQDGTAQVHRLRAVDPIAAARE